MDLKKYLDSDLAGIALVLAFSIGCLSILASWGGIERYILDDPYIVQHSVAGILAGSETRFVESDPWLGVTSPLFVVFVVLLAKFISIPLAHWLVSGACFIALTTGLYALGRQFSLRPCVSVLLMIGVMLSGHMMFQSTNGLETGMAMAAVTWLLIAFSRPAPPLWGYGLAGVLFLIRPELAALSGLCLIVPVWSLRRKALPGLAFFAIAMGAACAFSFLAVGSPFPNTADAKGVFYGGGAMPLPYKASVALPTFLYFLLSLGPLFFGLFTAFRSRTAIMVYGMTVALVLAYTIKLPESLMFNFYRYLYLLVPFLALGWCVILANKSPNLRLATPVIACVALGASLLNVPHFHKDWVELVNGLNRDNLRAATWAAQNIPADDTILVHDAGAISRVGTQPLVDLVGLKTPSTVEIHKQHPSVNRDRSMTAVPLIAQRANAKYIIILDDWDGDFAFTKSLKQAGWKVDRADSEAGQSLYRIYRLTPPTDGPSPAVEQ